MDELDARLRNLRPNDVGRHSPRTVRVEHHRRQLLRQSRSADRYRRSLIFVTAAAVLVVIAVAFGVLKVGTDQAYALTPPPLSFEPDDRKVDDVVKDAISSLGTAPGPGSPERRSTYVGWFAQIDMDAAATPVVIAPQTINLTWNDDLSAEQTVTAAPAYWADPDTREPVRPGTPSSGTVLSTTQFGPGEFGVPTVAPPRESTADMREFLASFGPTRSGAGDVMETIDSVLSLWTLTNQQHARLLEVLLESDDVEVLGTTTDRVGRPVVGLRAEPHSFPGTSRTLLLSAETGRIIGLETTRTTAEPPLNTGDVVAYKLWEVAQ